MQFPFSLVAAVFTFFSGTAAAGLFNFAITAIQKKKSAKVSLFLVAVAAIISSLTWYLVFIKNEYYVFPFSFLETKDFIFLSVLFVLGIMLMAFTKVFLSAAVPLYIVFSCLSFFSLKTMYPRTSDFQIVANSYNEMPAITVRCYKLKPYVLLPVPRIWYEKPVMLNGTAEEKVLNPIFDFLQKSLLWDDVPLNAELPAVDYYPAVFNVNVTTTATNAFLKLESAY